MGLHWDPQSGHSRTKVTSWGKVLGDGVVLLERLACRGEASRNAADLGKRHHIHRLVCLAKE